MHEQALLDTYTSLYCVLPISLFYLFLLILVLFKFINQKMEDFINSSNRACISHAHLYKVREFWISVKNNKAKLDTLEALEAAFRTCCALYKQLEDDVDEVTSADFKIAKKQLLYCSLKLVKAIYKIDNGNSRIPPLD
uniref:KIF-binding protein n=1 Tax=Panagrellus redivivus TaxID=6233 RepID=A0A7E4VR42_PANRE